MMDIVPIQVQAPRRIRTEEGQSSASIDLLVRMRADIVSNAISPEARLKFADLTARYGVGIGTLREALSHLLSEGFVTLDCRRGFRVAPASVEDLEDIATHFRELEARATRASIRNGGTEWRALVRRELSALEVFLHTHPAPGLRDHALWIGHRKAFHDALVSACPSHWLRKMRGLLFDQLDRYRFLTLMRRNTLTERPQAHRTIADAALAGNGDLVVELINEHISKTVENARRYLAVNS